jgi:hypothetical protein
MKVVLDSGEVIALGTTEATPTIGIIDYSKRVTDDFGVTTVVERGFARRMSLRLAVPQASVDALQRSLAGLRAKPALWVADDRYESLKVRGFYKDCTLTVEGLAESGTLADPGGNPAPGARPSTLQLLQPAIVTDALLLSSDVAETDHPQWAAGTTYAAGARVLRGAAHRIYESAIGGNVGVDPTSATGKWIDAGPTNRWAMFDQALGTATKAPSTVTVRLNASGVTAIALLDVVGSTVRVQTGVYDRTVAVGAGAITFLDLPCAAGEVRVTIAGPTQVSVGTLLAGRLVSLGITEASPTAGITDYSRKDVDDFGAVTIVERAWAKRMEASALIRTDAIDAVAARITKVRAQPALWIGRAGLDSLTIYGFFKDFSIAVGKTVSKLTLSVEGLSAAAQVAPLGAGINWPDIADPDGTKPSDNADKTSDNVSKDTAAVDGRPAANVVASLDGNTFAQALSTSQAELARIRTRALNFPGPAGEDSYTLIRREVTERRDADGVFAETFEILGARTPDGTSFVINTSTVRIGADESLAHRFDAIAATFADNAASIEHIDQVLVGPDGASARALVTVDVNGRIIGTALTNDGSEGAMVVSADTFRIEDPDTGKAYFYADDDGKVLMRDVEVDTLKVGSVDYAAMQLGAAQKAAFYTLPSVVAVPKNSTVQIASLSFVKEDDSSILEIQMLMKCASDDDFVFDATIQIDGMVMDTTPVNAVFARNNARLPITPFTYAAGISAGARTVSVKIYNRETDADDLSVLSGSTLKVVELRKGSIGSATGSGGAIPPPSGDGPGGDGPGDVYDGRGPRQPQLITN